MFLSLLRLKGVLPYIFVIFMNAIVDLGDKILLQNTIFKIYDGSTQIILTAFVNALILIPFVLFFTPAGFLSDRFKKSSVLRESSKLALVLTMFIMCAFYFGWFEIALLLTFLLALQSAIFSPAKYGLIKELFGKENLTEGNAIVQAVTIIAILSSSLIFSMIFESFLDGSESTTGDILEKIWPITLLLVLFALIEVYLTGKVPSTVDGDSKMVFEKEKYLKMHYLKENLNIATSNRVIVESIVGLAIFYAVSQVLLAIFGVHLKEVANEHNTVIAQAIMAMAGLGIAVGSIVTMRLSHNYIETGMLPFGTLGVALSVYAISKTSNLWMLGAEFFLFGLFGGFLIVILNALIQYRAKEHQLGRVMAASNFAQNILMLSFLGLTMFAALYSFSTTSIFITLDVLLVLSTLYTIITLPQFFLRFLFKIIALSRYKFSIHGVENFPKDGAALLLGNHVSWIDWLIVAISSPRRVSFVMERNIYNVWYLKPIFQFFGVIPISTKASKSAFEAIKEKLNKGKIVVIFPEGAISRNGHLGKFQRGFENITKDSTVPVIPFYIRGLWGSRFSYAGKKLRDNLKKSQRHVGVSFGKPLYGRVTATTLKNRIFELQIASWYTYTENLPPLQHSWLKMAKSQGNKLSVADATGVELSNHKLLAVVFAFSSVIRRYIHVMQNVGIVMPTSVGGSILNLSVLTLGKTVVNLNYTANEASIKAAIKNASLDVIFTSRQFLQKLKEKGIHIEDALTYADVIYVEDLKAQVKKSLIIRNLLLIKILPAFVLEKLFLAKSDVNDTAAILFSSGSENAPKGIMLTHKNIMGNIRQFANLLNFREDDVIMATLPTFHSFGLTVAFFCPLVEGVPYICAPDPTDAETVGKLTAKYRGSLLFGTSTFFRIYTKSKKLIPLMFESIRFIAAGAEKLSNDVRVNFKQKFGKDIHEGYGTTETTPVASCNIPDVLNTKYWNLQIGHKPGTVGMPLPGSTFKVVDPDTLEELKDNEEGMILVGGAQVMKGYLNDPKKTAEVIYENDGIRWYITGDKGKLDEDGFLTIVDRYSQFVKIGGEMISLGAVEEAIRLVLPEEIDIVATGAKDARKGEQVVLLYHGEIEEKEIKSLIKQAGLNPLMVPNSYFYLESLPKLGSGKTDLKAAKKLAAQLTQS